MRRGVREAPEWLRSRSISRPRLPGQEPASHGWRRRRQMERGLSRGAVMAAARGLAIERDEARSVRAKVARPVHEAVREQVRIDAVHKDVQPARAGNAMMIGQKTAQKRQMVLAPFGDVVEIVARCNAGADDKKKHSQAADGPPRQASRGSSIPEKWSKRLRRRGLGPKSSISKAPQIRKPDEITQHAMVK